MFKNHSWFCLSLDFNLLSKPSMTALCTARGGSVQHTQYCDNEWQCSGCCYSSFGTRRDLRFSLSLFCGEWLLLAWQLREVMACPTLVHAASCNFVLTFLIVLKIHFVLNLRIWSYHSERWITRLADRWRAQQSAITIANCRIFWAAITWTQIAVLGIPETTFAWGSMSYHLLKSNCIGQFKFGPWHLMWFVTSLAALRLLLYLRIQFEHLMLIVFMSTVEFVHNKKLFPTRFHDLRRARLPAEFKHITKRRKRK